LGRITEPRLVDLWYKKNVQARFLEAYLARKVALPCYMFSHTAGFLEVNKWRAYNHNGRITEKRPECFKWHHVRIALPDFAGSSPLRTWRCHWHLSEIICQTALQLIFSTEAMRTRRHYHCRASWLERSVTEIPSPVDSGVVRADRL
jgi:hypothetical protein